MQLMTAFPDACGNDEKKISQKGTAEAQTNYTNSPQESPELSPSLPPHQLRQKR
jgi:hypothetical protein